MKIPKVIKAFSREFKVINDEYTSSKTNCWGQVDFRKDEIIFPERGKDFSIGQEKTVLMHELLHIVDVTFNLELSEDQVQRIAAGITTIIHDNKLDFSSNA